MMDFSGKRILVTGACGTVGSELVAQLLSNSDVGPEEVFCIDNDENALFQADQQYLNEPRVRFSVADVRDREGLVRRMEGIDHVFHAAALKHVILSERSPDQAVESNINGVQNVISAAQQCGVERVIFCSSDKAVNPTNVMGTSKLMGERLITAANSSKRGAGPVFASTRFGNVLGSSGSVVPIFHNQISRGGPVTVTDENMTRFVMSISEAVSLLIDSMALARGGEVFVTKMPVVRILGLAQVMIEKIAPAYGVDPGRIAIEYIGTKPGEKLYEELMSDEETRRAVELEKYFAILPAFRGVYHDIEYKYEGAPSRVVTNPYVSRDEQALTSSEIGNLLETHGLLRPPAELTSRRYWPGDKEELSP